MPPLDIQRSKLVYTIATSTRCNNTLNFMTFVIIVKNIFSTKAKGEGNTTCKHYHKTNLCNQIFSQVERAMYPLRIYNTKFLNYASIFWFVVFKNAMITHAIGLDYFFFDCWLWFPLTNFSTTTKFF
jgi:hypothetical protein